MYFVGIYFIGKLYVSLFNKNISLLSDNIHFIDIYVIVILIYTCREDMHININSL